MEYSAKAWDTMITLSWRVMRPRDGLHGGPRPVLKLLQRLAAVRELRGGGIARPMFKKIREHLAHITQGRAVQPAEIKLQQVILGNYGEVVRRGDGLRSADCSPRRARHNCCYVYRSKGARQRLRLRDSGIVERNVSPPLRAPLAIPLRLSVPHQVQIHDSNSASSSSSWSCHAA